MKFTTLLTFALAICTFFTGTPARADNMASIAITPATGVVTLTPRWAIGGNLAGFHHMAQNLGLTGSVANNFYSIKGTTIPAGGDILAFNFYLAGPGSATPHGDIGSKLTPDSYSALTSADPDVGYGSVNLYTIHHKGTTDYFTAIIPGSGTASAVTDLKPMSGPGGPATVTGVSGYFGLTFAAGNLGYGLNTFYYLRTDPVTGNTKFGTLAPALLGASADQFDLGTSGHKALTYTGTDVGYGVDKMYYLRLDPVTGHTILGLLDPALAGIRHTSDIANLGSVFTTLAFVPGDVGFGPGNFYVTGAVNPTWQSVSFAAIADRAIASGSFTVNPTASSALPIALTVVAGSTGSATISGPVGGVFTITPTAPGVITLQATQAGAVAPIPYEFNMLRQTFTATGVATVVPVISNSPLTSAATIGAPYNLAITASQSPTSYSASPLPAGLVLNSTTGAITGTPTTAGITDVLLGATNSLGTGNATLRITVAAAGVAPVITNNPLTAAGTVGSGFSFAVMATNAPTIYTATGLPAGLAIAASTGVISGVPTVAGSTNVLLGVANAFGIGSSTLTITIGQPNSPPSISSPTTAPATVGTPYTYRIIATGAPTSYTASALPAGLVFDAATGVISGTPTTAGTSVVTVGATNASGTSTSTITIVIAAVTATPIITSPTTAPATTGVPFVSYVIGATGLPTSYTATGLPPGLILNPLTGAINGTPTAAGTYLVVLTATNTSGTGTSTLTITVAPITVAPIITSPTTAPGTAGTPFVTYLIGATGLPTSYTATGLPAGLTLNPLTGAITGTPTTAGTSTVTLTASNSAGTSTQTLTIVVAPAAVAPILTSPTTAPGAAGTPFVTYVIAGTGLPTSFTATGLPPGLTVNTLTGAINGTPTTPGTYVVTIAATNATGTSTGTVTIVIAGPSSRIVNFSARALSGPGNETLIMGFVVSGDGKNLLVRGVGPGLTPYGVVNALADPMLTLFNATGAIASNDDWQTTAAGQANGALVAATAARVGAFALPNGSKDAALLAVFANGAHTTSMLRPNSTTGIALTEIYDTDTGAATSRLVNVSARMNVTAGEGTLIAGFVIAGNAPKTVLIRGVGPTLTSFAVTNVLADPQIAVFAGSSLVASNDNWSTGTSTVAQITGATAQAGAFALTAGSRDAALLLTLQPGNYTVQVTGVANTTGVALVEIYDLQ